jgi:outer membrane protein TolC
VIRKLVFLFIQSSCVIAILGTRSRAADLPVTLDEALQQAHAFNARLPLSVLEVESSQQKEREARAELWLKVAVEGEYVYIPPGSYDPVVSNGGETRLQLVGVQPIYDGGALRASITGATARALGARTRLRIAEKDLELDVRSRFSEFLEAQREIEIRRAGIDRLTNYTVTLKSRQVAGQGVAGDRLKAEVRLQRERADMNQAEGRLHEARLVLNDLMGRDPVSPLELAPLPEPKGPDASSGSDAWSHAPELEESETEYRSALAGVSLIQAERKPHLFLRATVGFWGSATNVPGGTLRDRYYRDSGYSLGVAFSWTVWDAGVYSARLAQSRLDVEKAEVERLVVRREAQLHWEIARETMSNLYEQIQILSSADPVARDSFLATESRYRGGVATALEVLDAYSESVDTAVRLAEALMRFRLAEAVALRWGTP